MAAFLAMKLAGTYRFPENFYRPNYELEVKNEDGYLITDWGYLIPLDNEDEKTPEFILRTYWSSIRFLENESDNIAKMQFDRFTGTKIK